MTRIVLFIFAVFLSSASSLSVAANNGCFVKTNSDFAYQHPLLLNLTKNEFILPNVKDGIKFASGEQVRLACPGQQNKIQISSVKEAIATCVSEKNFTLNGSNYLFKQLRCVQYPESIARRTGRKCSVKYTEIEIGFNISTGFIPIMTNCMDETTKNSLYSKFHMTKMIKSQQYNVPRPNGFKEGDFYNGLNPKISTLYVRSSQLTAFERILKSKALAKKYISLTSDFFLSRGHLTSKADFVYGSQQHATFFYVNVAPQWQTFNGNNWVEVEKSTRNYAHKRKLDLDVYTGIFGNSRLPDVNNIYRNLSLYVDKNNNHLITVPEIYWRVIHDPASNKGVVLIGHNNPYNNNVTKVCKDVSDKLNWVTWDSKNVTAGISYGCDFGEFKKVVDYIPNIPITNLLT